MKFLEEDELYGYVVYYCTNTFNPRLRSGLMILDNNRFT